MALESFYRELNSCIARFDSGWKRRHSVRGGVVYTVRGKLTADLQNQRVFVPEEALESVQVLGVIGSPLRRRAKEAAKDKENQLEMFD